MKNEILWDDINEFQKKYLEEKNNINIEKRIKEQGIMKESVEDSKKTKFKFKFNVEVPEIKIYNQLKSHQCNTYAFLRVVKDILRKNKSLNVDKLDLSSNYINFFDKLEKSNILYNDLINCSDLTLEKINNKVNYNKIISNSD